MSDRELAEKEYQKAHIDMNGTASVNDIQLALQDAFIKGRQSMRSEVERLEKERDAILGLHDAWPLCDVLYELSRATDILLHEKNYDGQGYEEMQIAMRSAKEFLSQLKKQKPVK